MMRCRTGREAPRNKAARIKNHHDKEVRCGRREIATRYDGAGSITFLSGLKKLLSLLDTPRYAHVRFPVATRLTWRHDNTIHASDRVWIELGRSTPARRARV